MGSNAQGNLVVEIQGSTSNGASSALNVNLATTIAGEDIPNDVLKVETRVAYLNGTTSQVIKTGAGRFHGFMVNSHSSGTLKFWDNISPASTVIFNTITFASGPSMWIFPKAIDFTTGLYITVGGTCDYTVLYK